MKSRQVQLVEYPRGTVEPRHFRVAEVDLPDPGEGEGLVRNTFTSVDPGMRLRLPEGGPEGYFDSFPLNDAMDEILTVGEVVESRAEGFSPGDEVSHAWGWRDYSVVKGGEFSLGGGGAVRRAGHRRRRDAAPARHGDPPGRQVPRPGGHHGLDSLRRPHRRRAREGGGRHLGL